MKGQKPIFSKGKDDWRTPRALFEKLNEEFGFTCDVAADATNKLTHQWQWLGPGSPWGEDALQAAWSAVNWCNPPYSKVKEFVAKASQEMLMGRKTVMLIPARTDTRWFHEFIYQHLYNRVRMGVRLRFLKGRVKFVDPHLEPGKKQNGAPFPSMLVIFG